MIKESKKENVMNFIKQMVFIKQKKLKEVESDFGKHELQINIVKKLCIKAFFFLLGFLEK